MKVFTVIVVYVCVCFGLGAFFGCDAARLEREAYSAGYAAAVDSVKAVRNTLEARK